MSAAQTKARARFKAAVKEAGKLRKKNPKLSQADAVKQAWVILYGKARTGKKVGAPAKKTARKPAAKKAAPVKKCAPKKPATHSDSKSHNVNIRVMSGISDVLLDAQKRREDIIKRVSKLISDNNKIIDNINKMTPTQRGRAKAIIMINKRAIINYKKEIKILDTIVKQHISK